MIAGRAELVAVLVDPPGAGDRTVPFSLQSGQEGPFLQPIGDQHRGQLGRVHAQHTNDSVASPRLTSKYHISRL